MGRRAISKRTRFEVLKRDKFRCQYCGRAAPEVVLHVDHITPVAGKGKNDLLNLVSACADCNLGKSAVPLSDGSAVEKRRAQAELQADRMEQIEMMARWGRDLSESKEEAVRVVVEAIDRLLAPTRHLNDVGRATVRRWTGRLPLRDVLESVDEAGATYLPDNFERFLAMVPKYAARKPDLRERPHLRRFFYASAILRNRLGPCPVGLFDESTSWGHWGRNVVDVMDSLHEGFATGLSVEGVVSLAKEATDYDEFFTRLFSWDENNDVFEPEGP